jgi:spore coat polysaccharide biosynthesis protein SpsF
MWLEDKNPAWREHVTQFLHHHPDRFTIHGVQNERDLSAMRWTVDTPEDFELVRRIYENFGHDRFAWREVVTLFEENPEWLQINCHVQQKVVQ